ECDESDFLQLYEREHRYRWIEVETRHLDTDTPSSGRMCTGYSDNDYRRRGHRHRIAHGYRVRRAHQRHRQPPARPAH
ncbi:hypothetical protein, partial [Klebsiella pneumoniae]|uniref:hypothetical protein n=1 Tax=Klebsiella pneumoniae TaxID=573 RepID=UPI002731643B